MAQIRQCDKCKALTAKPTRELIIPLPPSVHPVGGEPYARFDLCPECNEELWSMLGAGGHLPELDE